MANFEVDGGNGRLYPVSPEDKAKEKARMEAKGEELNADWLKTKEAHDYDGFINIDALFVEWLSQGVAASETGTARMNIKGFKARKMDGSPQLNVQDHYIKGLGEFKKWKAQQDQSGQAAPASSGSTPNIDDFDDDDIPF
tara:strand:- start:855 stop:1274 length:420 start_codon:yes stop_codon:yes gene_type:complete